MIVESTYVEEAAVSKVWVGSDSWLMLAHDCTVCALLSWTECVECTVCGGVE